MDCEHKKLELRGHIKPEGLPENCLWVNDLSMVCLDCGVHLMNSPKDLTCIINIPHPARDKCTHPFNVRSYPLCGLGAWQCLQCGEKGVSAPVRKLEIRDMTREEDDSV